MPLYDSIIDTIGKTPTIKLHKISSDLPVEIFAKIEFFNPGGSIKDRPALNMIAQGEKQGLITKDTEIVEATSGNTGIGLAMVTAAKGYKMRIFMPENASVERQKIMKAYGAKVVLTPVDELMGGAVSRAKEYSEKNNAVFLTDQFKNENNPDIHRKTTAQEIWKDLDGKIDVFVSCVGTGGTITGTGQALKKLNSEIKVIAVEPTKSPVLSGGKPGKHSMEGMGAGFIPDVLDTTVYDEIIAISKEEAYEHSKLLAKSEGIFAGKSSGAALAAAIKYTKKTMKKERILIIIPDTGERYLSTDLWDE